MASVPLPFLQRILSGQPWRTPGINGSPVFPSAPVPLPAPAPAAAPGPSGPAWLQKFSGGVDKIINGLGGAAPGQQLAPEQRAAVISSLMQGAGPVPRGTQGVLAPFGAAMQASQQAKQQADENAMRKQLLEAQIARTQTGGADPARVQEYNFARQNGFTGTFPDYLKQFYGREQNSPASLQEWEAFAAMTPQQQAQYLEMKRSGQLSTIGGVPTYLPPGVGSGVASTVPLSTLADETDAQRQLKDAQAQGQAQGGARGEAVANLPTIQNATRAAIETVDKMLAHPGMATATGLSGTLDPRNYIPGTDARNFQVLRNQAQGQVFLDAFQALKGGGAITEVEGLKAEQAKARMDSAQSDEEFRIALNDYKAALQRGLALAEQKAGYATGGGFGGQPAQGGGEQPAPGAVNWNDL